MRLLFALALLVLALVLVASLLLMRPAWAGSVRCTIYEVKSPGRLQTLCDDGTRAVTSTPRPSPGGRAPPPSGKTCTGRLNPKTC